MLGWENERRSNGAMRICGAHCEFIEGGANGHTRAFVMGATKHKAHRSQPIVAKVYAKPDRQCKAVSDKGMEFNFRHQDDMFVILNDNIVNQCSWVPDELFGGLGFSKGYMYFMQRVQLKRHLKWFLRKHYRNAWGGKLSGKNIDNLVRIAGENYTGVIKRTQGIDLDTFVPTDDDNLIVDENEYGREFARRYGAEFRNR